MTLLAVEDLTVTLETIHGPGHAVRNLSFKLAPGDTLGIVGESGCGKSITALAILGLLPDNAEATGTIHFNNQNLLAYNDHEMRKIRGDRISIIFQEPMTSLNPVHTIGQQIVETIMVHRSVHKIDAKKEALQLLDMVGIGNAKSRFNQYPHQLSGGQRQRIMIAIALANTPDILIADEPTTAVDVMIQNQILKLIRSLVEELGMALILISHDLSVISAMVDRIIVMYGGTAVEVGATRTIFSNVSHPYTKGLLSAIPRISTSVPVRQRRLKTIPGAVPELTDIPTGCVFSDRCSIASSLCAQITPPTMLINEDHYAVCHHLDRVDAK